MTGRRGVDLAGARPPRPSVAADKQMDPGVALFPLAALPGQLSQFVHEVASGLPCPPEFIALPCLVVLGAAIGGVRLLEVRSGWYERASVYAAVVAEPGSRKSPALDIASEPLRRRNRELAERYRAESDAHRSGAAMYEVNVSSWKEAKRRAAAGKGDDPGEMPAPPEEPLFHQVSTSDSTIEAFADLLDQNERGVTFLRDELAGWVRSMNQYRGGAGADRQTWLSFWNGASTTINRRSRQGPLVIERPFVSVVGCLPPDVLRELSDERGREDGFVHRIVFSYPDPVRLRWTDSTVSPGAVNEYVQLYERLAALAPGLDNEPAVVRFTPGGTEAFAAWATSHYEDLERVDERLRGPWAKLEAYAARFSLIIQELRFVTHEVRSEDVDEASVGVAADLIAYFKSHARRVYDRLHANPRDRQVIAALDWLRRRRLREVTARDLRRAKVGGATTPEAAYMLLRELEQRGFGTVETPGRGSVLFRLYENGASRHEGTNPPPRAEPPGAAVAATPLPRGQVDAPATTTRHQSGDDAATWRNSTAAGFGSDLAPGTPASRCATSEERAAYDEIPRLGDGGYLEWLTDRRAHLTEREWRQLRLLHFTVFRATAPPDPRGEAGVIADLASMVDAREVATASPHPLCRYKSHRDAGDWRGSDKRLRCRVCHPPAPGAEQ